MPHSELPRPVFADARGRLHTASDLCAVGRSGWEIWELADDDLIPLPPGSDLFYAVGRIPLAMNPRTGELEEIHPASKSSKTFPVAAILPIGFTRLFLPAWQRENDICLPLFGYTAVASLDGELVVAACQTDDSHRWNPLNYDSSELPRLVDGFKAKFRGNRIVEQLGRCAIEYHCLTARNLFYRRWEAGIPISPVCNAHCLGCISLQESECCPAPQSRISFLPTVDEIVEVAVDHLENAEDPIISFGQGCEGEPLLRGEDLVEAVYRIRRRTPRGSININTNGSNPKLVKRLAECGLDSMRVSLLSANDESYARYHRPEGYTLSDVFESIRVAGELGVFVSLNLLLMPGFTDQEAEAEALFRLLDDLPVGMVQLRNLNLDPDVFFDTMSQEAAGGIGVKELIDRLRSRYPNLRVGSFTPPVHQRTVRVGGAE